MPNPAPRWMFFVLVLAGVYNLAWGAWAVLFPTLSFAYSGMQDPDKPLHYPQLWQCIGMMVGVYGVGYAIAASNPVRHWSIILVGLLGKIFGPIGFIHAAWRSSLPWKAGWVIVTNDLIWWLPFVAVLWACRSSIQSTTMK